ncbi:MAG: DUF839 domain-containing protein [Candidatus Nanopelagicales bacterium]|nr:DUF839 domain-containing protein [Candidatus Nanopelagicales bacterium]
MRIAYPIAASVAAGAVLLGVTSAQADSGFAYMEPVASGVSLKVLATAGDSLNGYTVMGVPDGMGILQDGRNLTLLMNHELSAANAVAAAAKRAGGAASGSTVSAFNYDTASATIVAGTELLKSVTWYDYSTGQTSTKPVAPAGADAKDSFGTPNHTAALNRFCSSYTAQPGTLSYSSVDANGKSTTVGYTGPAYFTGEEGGDESRGFVSDNAGNLIQLPRLGLAAWENFIVAPPKGTTTVVMGNEDGDATDSQLFMYAGTKTTAGSWVDKAGLTNGNLYVMAINGYNDDNLFRAAVGKGKAVPVSFNQIDWTKNGKIQNQQARAAGSVLARVEDGAFDPKNPNDYYFLTTESDKDAKATSANPLYPGAARDGGALWRVRFADVNRPTAGATIEMLLDGSESIMMNKPDNMAIDAKGNLLIQEDPGNNDHVARIVAYRISDGKVGTVARFKDLYFAKGGAQLMTRDEESSGVVDATPFLAVDGKDAKSYFFFNAQVHAPTAVARPDIAANPASAQALKDAIEGGQIYLMTIDDWSKVYG